MGNEGKFNFAGDGNTGGTTKVVNVEEINSAKKAEQASTEANKMSHEDWVRAITGSSGKSSDALSSAADAGGTDSIAGVLTSAGVDTAKSSAAVDFGEAAGSVIGE